MLRRVIVVAGCLWQLAINMSDIVKYRLAIQSLHSPRTLSLDACFPGNRHEYRHRQKIELLGYIVATDSFFYAINKLMHQYLYGTDECLSSTMGLIFFIFQMIEAKPVLV